MSRISEAFSFAGSPFAGQLSVRGAIRSSMSKLEAELYEFLRNDGRSKAFTADEQLHRALENELKTARRMYVVLELQHLPVCQLPAALALLVVEYAFALSLSSSSSLPMLPLSSP
jgi:hypothetical protein